MPVAPLADLVAATIDVVAPLAGRDPAAIATEAIAPRPGEKAYEELMTEDESTRARDIGEMYAVLPAIEAHPAVVAAYRDAPRRAGRRLPLRRGRADDAATRSPARRRGVRERDGRRRSDGRPSAHEGPRHRRGRVHRPLGRRRAARARPHGPPRRQPRRRRRGEPRGVRGPPEAAARSRSATSATRRPAGAGPARSTRSPTSRPRSRSRTRSTTRRRRSTTTSSARSTCSRAPAPPARGSCS